MKNSATTFESKKESSNFLRRSSLVIFSILLFQLSSLNAATYKIDIYQNDDPFISTLVDPYFSDIINKMKIGHFFNATVITLNEKTKGKRVDVFSSYAFTQEVDKLNDSSIELKNLNTSFSDRAHFSGSKTIEKIILKDNGSKVNIEVTFITWSNTRVVLTNVTLKKINMVTFITGHVLNGNNATYYTIALQDKGKLI